MANFPCPTSERCPGTDFPVLNTSSEDFDRFTFIGRYFGQVALDPTVTVTTPPYIDQQPFTASGCVGVCESSVSQEEADLCAERQQVDCVEDSHDLTSPPSPPNTPINVFSNTAQSCSFPCPDGLLFTFTVPAGTFKAINQILANRVAHSYACRQAALLHVCLSSIQSEACISVPYTATITASGNLGSFTQPEYWEITSGSLPPGLHFNGGFRNDHMATITGTPTTAGSYNFTVRVTNFRGDFMAKPYTICVIALSPSSSTLPQGTTGLAYSQTITATACASTPLAWTIASGSLPNGLTLNVNTGQITGTPTVAGTFNFTVSAATGAT